MVEKPKCAKHGVEMEIAWRTRDARDMFWRCPRCFGENLLSELAEGHSSLRRQEHVSLSDRLDTGLAYLQELRQDIAKRRHELLEELGVLFLCLIAAVGFVALLWLLGRLD